jgi:hypothetical protein
MFPAVPACLPESLPQRPLRPLFTAMVLFLLALAGALPVQAEPLGAQVRVSQVGPDGNANFDGQDPAVAYNSQANQYLVVWEGDDSTHNETEIYGRLLDTGGGPLGGEFRVSDMGPDGNVNFAASDPSVAYDAQANEYLVVWEGDDNTAPLVDNEFEIFGQRLSAAGAEIGANDFRISDMGPNGNINFAAFDPSVVHNSQSNEYLAVWEGDDDTAPLVDNEREIFGQRLSTAGGALGTNDFRISDMGPDGNANFDGRDPAAATGPGAREYTVFWEGDDNTAPLVDNEFEIFGQRLSTAGGALGPNDFRVSQLGPNEDPNFDAFDPSGAYNSKTNQYLAAWEGDDNTAPLVDNEVEIFARRSSAADTVPPSLRLSGSTRQRFARQRAVIVFATADEASRLTATARLSVPGASRTFKLRKSRSLKAGKRTKVKFRLSRRVNRAVRRALLGHKRVRARVTARATDASGNSSTAKRRIRGRR